MLQAKRTLSTLFPNIVWMSPFRLPYLRSRETAKPGSKNRCCIIAVFRIIRDEMAIAIVVGYPMHMLQLCPDKHEKDKIYSELQQHL